MSVNDTFMTQRHSLCYETYIDIYALTRTCPVSILAFLTANRHWFGNLAKGNESGYAGLVGNQRTSRPYLCIPPILA